jgi:D-alanyl-D-alanine carboxypeptidase
MAGRLRFGYVGGGRLRAALLTAAAAVVGLLAAAGPAAAALSASRADAVFDRVLSRLVIMPGGPPGVVAVVQRGNRRFVFSHGVADLRSRRPINIGDNWRIASASKAFSGAVALRLVAQGKLHLDDTIAKYLPGLPAAWGQVTLAEALQHTSGLPDFAASPVFGRFVSKYPRLTVPPQRLLGFVADRPLGFPPGSGYHYSNSDNVVVALFAQAATGLSYEQLLAELVTDPLSLRHTLLPAGYRMVAPFVHGYDNNVRGRRADESETFSMSYAFASGGMVSSPLDLTSFVRAFVGGKLFGGATRARQLSIRPGGGSDPPGPGANAAGLGVFRYRTRCGTVYGHTGNTPGYTTFIAASQNAKRSVTVLASTQLNYDPLLGARVGSQAAFRALRRSFELGVCAALASG